MKVSLKPYRRARKDELNLFKEKQQCCMCPTTMWWPGVALDFHHRNPADKEFEIAQNADCNAERLWREVAKCLVVCAGHHRIIHDAERNK